MTNFNERIAELAELEKHVLPLNWETSGASNEDIVDSRNMFVAETSSDDEAALIVALRNEALPLLREMHGEIERLQNDYQTALRALALSRQQVYEMEDKLNA